MSKRKLYVYVVHQAPNDVAGEDYRVLGVYLDKTLAEKHKQVAYEKQDDWGSYISVTKHAVRGGYTNLGSLVII